MKSSAAIFFISTEVSSSFNKTPPKVNQLLLVYCETNLRCWKNVTITYCCKFLEWQSRNPDCEGEIQVYCILDFTFKLLDFPPVLTTLNLFSNSAWAAQQLLKFCFSKRTHSCSLL